MRKNFLNNQKGISSIDCVVSIVIIIMLLGIIMILYNNTLVNMKLIDRRTDATRILINIAENMETIYYENFENAYMSLPENAEGEHYCIGDNNIQILNTNIPLGYTVYLKEIYDEKNIENIIKIIVEYKINGEKKTISLMKTLNKEGN